MVVDKISYEKTVMSYMATHNFTNPHCYGKYLATVSRSVSGMNVSVGLDNSGFPSSCNTIPSSYYTCTSKDNTTQLHPCSLIRSYFHVFFIVNESN